MWHSRFHQAGRTGLPSYWSRLRRRRLPDLAVVLQAAGRQRHRFVRMRLDAVHNVFVGLQNLKEVAAGFVPNEAVAAIRTAGDILVTGAEKRHSLDRLAVEVAAVMLKARSCAPNPIFCCSSVRLEHVDVLLRVSRRDLALARVVQASYVVPIRHLVCCVLVQGLGVLEVPVGPKKSNE